MPVLTIFVLPKNHIMKKAAFFLLCAALAGITACQKAEDITPSKDATLVGEKVDVSSIGTGIRKVFVLNEGGMGSNNSTLDLLRMEDGNYITNAFGKMNPDVAGGLGDVGNDLIIIDKQVWIVVNNSGIVEVISAEDETEIAAIQVPTPRNIACDGTYAYVTSWAGAYAKYDDNNVITDYSNPKGQVYRINLSTKTVEGSVEVGYQPEGIAYQDGKLYVANSGGISSQITWTYDNTVSIIDTKTFTVTKTLEVGLNPKTVLADGNGNVYVTILGDYWSTHSGLYMIDANDAVTHISDYVSVAEIDYDMVWCIGAENEWDWNGEKVWKTFSCKAGIKVERELKPEGKAIYGICALGGQEFLISDAGDYFNPGTVSLYSGDKKVWTVTAGVCPGHFAIW